MVLLEGCFELHVELDQAVHGNGDGQGVDDGDPDVGKDGRVGAFAVALKVLRDDGGDGHGYADEAVLVDADPVDVEPGQPALGSAPGPALAAAAFGEPVDGHNPWRDGAHFAEEVLLCVQVGRDVVAEETKERRNGKCLVAVRDDLEVDGVPVPLDLEEGRDGVDGDHKENTDDELLLLGFRVVRGVHEDEEETQHDRDERACGTNDAREVMEGQAADKDDFRARRYAHVLQRGVAR